MIVFKRFYHAVLTLAAILVCLAAGKFVNHHLGGLPASLYGLLFFAGLLHTHYMSEQVCADLVSKIIYYMPIVFLPVCVGVMNYFDLLAEIGIKVLIIGISTTMFGIVVVASSAQFALSRSSRKAEQGDD